MRVFSHRFSLSPLLCLPLTALLWAAPPAALVDTQANPPLFDALVNKARQATEFYDAEVDAAHRNWRNYHTRHCEYQDDAEACAANAQQVYRDSWKLNEATPLNANSPLARVIAESSNCQGAGLEHYSYLQLHPQASLAQKRINALLEPLILPPSEPTADDFTEEGKCMYTEVDQHQTLVYASRNYVAVKAQNSVYFYGAAHPMHNGYTLHFDTDTGLVLQQDEVFNEGDITPLASRCVAQLAKETEMSADEYGEMYAADVYASFQDIERWSFTSSSASIEFPPYLAAAYAYGFLRCDFTAAELEPYLQESFLERL